MPEARIRLGVVLGEAGQPAVRWLTQRSIEDQVGVEAVAALVIVERRLITRARRGEREDAGVLKVMIVTLLFVPVDRIGMGVVAVGGYQYVEGDRMLLRQPRHGGAI